MRIEQLRCIADIAETGSLTATAQRQFITQQAVSKMIKQMEKELDATILVRSRTGVSFTEIGKELVSFAQKVLVEEVEFQKHINLIKQEQHRSKHNNMYIASTSAITNFLLPVLLSSTQIQKNNVSVHINQSTSYEDVAQQVFQKKSDFGLITINETALPQLMTPYHKELEAAVIMKDKLIAVVDKRFYTGDVLKLTEEEFVQYPVKTLYNVHPIDMFQEPIKELNIICSGDADFHRNMMEKAGALTLMPVTTHHLHFNNKRYVPLVLADELSQHSLLHVAIFRKNNIETMENLLNLLRREIIFEGIKTK